MSRHATITLVTPQGVSLMLGLVTKGGLTCMATLHAKPSAHERKTGILTGETLATAFAEVTDTRVEPAFEDAPPALWIGRTAFDLTAEAAVKATEWLVAKQSQQVTA